MCLTHFIECQLVADWIRRQRPVEKLENARRLVGVEIVVDVRSAFWLPERIGVVFPRQYIVPYSGPNCARSSPDRHLLRSAKSSRLPEIYQHGQRPSCGGQDACQCANNRMMVAPEMPSDHASGGDHSGVPRRPRRPKPWKSHTTASAEKGPPALPQLF